MVLNIWICFQKSKGTSVDGGSRLASARKLHFEVCSLLLASLESLQRTLNEFLELMSNRSATAPNGDYPRSENGMDARNSSTTAADYQKRFFERAEMKKVLQTQYHNYGKYYSLIQEFLILPIKHFYISQVIDSEDDFLALAKSDISQLCGEVVMHWKLFLDTVNGNSTIGKYLAKVHHFYRVSIY